MLPSAETVTIAPPDYPRYDFSSCPCIVGLHLTLVKGMASWAAYMAYAALWEWIGGFKKAGVCMRWTTFPVNAFRITIFPSPNAKDSSTKLFTRCDHLLIWVIIKTKYLPCALSYCQPLLYLQAWLYWLCDPISTGHEFFASPTASSGKHPSPILRNRTFYLLTWPASLIFPSI